jgi:hypothetical protein
MHRKYSCHVSPCDPTRDWSQIGPRVSSHHVSGRVMKLVRHVSPHDLPVVENWVEVHLISWWVSACHVPCRNLSSVKCRVGSYFIAVTGLLSSHGLYFCVRRSLVEKKASLFGGPVQPAWDRRESKRCLVGRTMWRY